MTFNKEFHNLKNKQDKNKKGKEIPSWCESNTKEEFLCLF